MESPIVLLLVMAVAVGAAAKLWKNRNPFGWGGGALVIGFTWDFSVRLAFAVAAPDELTSSGDALALNLATMGSAAAVILVVLGFMQKIEKTTA